MYFFSNNTYIINGRFMELQVGLVAFFFLQYINNTTAFKFGENVFGIRERTNGWFVKRKCMHVCTYIYNLHVDFASWC